MLTKLSQKMLNFAMQLKVTDTLHREHSAKTLKIRLNPFRIQNPALPLLEQTFPVEECYLVYCSA